jgi:hypothetical protein
LLLKLVHRAHDPESSAWSQWLELEFGSLLDATATIEEGVHLASLRCLLPNYMLLSLCCSPTHVDLKPRFSRF